MGKTVVVKTSCGKLRGSIQKSIEGYDYCAFKGVPYAKPPVGELRFQDPQPPEPWKGTRDATSFGPVCAQYNQFEREYIGCDDCLYLNVYVKSVKSGARLPVMMWIHGGAFTFGCGDDQFYGPDYLLRKDIVLVTFNYRLGVLGFLNLEDEAAPGNQGLKDQVMVLKWIQENISKFGGDPKNVTVFGESAGGSSVTYLSLSPLSKDLFHKAISQSGVGLNLWITPPNPKQYAHKLCKLLGKEIEEPKEIVNFLKTIDCLQLAKMSEKMRTNKERIQFLYPFGPGVDNKSTNPMMPIPIGKAAKNGIEIPYLLGYNNREGIYALAALQSRYYEDLDKNFSNYIHPGLVELLREHNLTPHDLRVIYNCTKFTAYNYKEKIVDLLGDMYMAIPCHRLIKSFVLQNLAPIYFYKFTYDQGMSFTKLIVNTTMSGASHFDELPYLFPMRFYETLGIEPLSKGTFDYKLMEQMTEMWTNFAKSGKPTPVTSTLIPKKWAPVTNPTLLRYMNIGNELNSNSMINVEQRLINGKSVISKL